MKKACVFAISVQKHRLSHIKFFSIEMQVLKSFKMVYLRYRFHFPKTLLQNAEFPTLRVWLQVT